MGRSDFLYEWQLKNCPIDEETAAKIVAWMDINLARAKQYGGVSTARAVLIMASRDLKANLSEVVYQTTGFDRQ